VVAPVGAVHDTIAPDEVIEVGVEKVLTGA
jgi:hypothetical protein